MIFIFHSSALSFNSPPLPHQWPGKTRDAKKRSSQFPLDYYLPIQKLVVE